MSSLPPSSLGSSLGKAYEPTALVEALDWLHSAPGGALPHTSKDGPLLDLLPLRKHLKAIGGLHLAPSVLLRVIDLFEARVVRIHDILTPLLLDASLPLPRHLRTVSRGLIDIHDELAQCLLQLVRKTPAQSLEATAATTVALRALLQLEQYYLITLHIFSATSHELWKNALMLWHYAQQALATQPATENPLDPPLKRMLAMAAAQTDSLTPREVNFLLDYVQSHTSAIALTHDYPEQDEQSWYWVDASGERGPTAFARRAPHTLGNELLFFSCAELMRLAKEHLGQMKRGQPPQKLGLPSLANAPDYQNALQHAMRHWGNPPQRAKLRKRSNYRVQLCVSLGKLWYLLKGELPPGDLAGSEPTSEWVILNETTEGFSAMHVNGTVRGLLSGTAVGMRLNEEAPWCICIVRWSRSDNPEHLELGLEALAPTAQAARYTYAGNADPIPALFLPALPATQRREAVLTTHADAPPPGRFLLLVEDADRLQITECAMRNEIEQTASISLHTFERITYPG